MKKILIFFLSIFIAFIFPLSAIAYDDLPNWPVYHMQGECTEPFIVEDIIPSSPGKEVLGVQYHSGSLKSNIRLWSEDGTLMAGWPYIIDSFLSARVSVGDFLPSNPGLEIVVVANHEIVMGDYETIVYLLGNDGSLLAGWPKTYDNDQTNISYPVAADIDINYPGDEVIVMILGNLYIFYGDGTDVTNWPYLWPSTEKEVANTPAVADIDSDSEIEIVTVFRDGNVTPFNPDKTVVTGWPQDIHDVVGGNLLDPIIGDIDNDNSLEIITGEGYSPFRFHIFENDGSAFSRWPMDDINLPLPESTIALADINPAIPGLEIVMTNKRDVTINPAVYIFDLDGNVLDGFPYELADSTYVSYPVVFNIDNDDEPEILFFGRYYSFPLTYRYPRLYAVNFDGSSADGFPINFDSNDTIITTIASSDIDEDGSANLVLCYYTALSFSMFYGYGRTLVWNLGIEDKPWLSYWTTFRSDSGLTGFYQPPPPRPNPSPVPILPESGKNLIGFINRAFGI